MKSQVYKIRNLKIPDGVQPHTIRLKPVSALFFLVVAGILMMFAGGAAITVGFIVMLVALFAMTMLPDRVLVQFYPDFMLMYNQKDRLSCMLIDYKEIVQWRYEYGRSWDHMTIFLTDGSSETIEMFSRASIHRFMNLYAPGKEVKNVRMKEERL